MANFQPPMLPASASAFDATAVANATDVYADAMSGVSMSPPVAGHYAVLLEGQWFQSSASQNGAIALNLNGALVALNAYDGGTTERLYGFVAANRLRSFSTSAILINLLTTDQVSAIFRTTGAGTINLSGIRRITMWQVAEP
jgi:hypothetical protein